MKFSQVRWGAFQDRTARPAVSLAEEVSVSPEVISGRQELCGLDRPREHPASVNDLGGQSVRDAKEVGTARRGPGPKVIEKVVWDAEIPIR